MLKQSRVTPFLMFQDGNAEAAMRFYISIFPDGRFLQFETHEAGGVALEGKVLLATIEIAGQEVRFSDSPPVHDFDFTPSMSLYVHCAHQEELDRLAAALVDGGEFLMPPADYGFSQKFAFVKDRFGVSWQLNVPHDPTR
ncbi:MAG: VOC family protein [Planctomycetota bacterium]